MNGMIDILFLLFEHEILQILWLIAFKLSQPTLHCVVFLAHLIYHLQQLLYLEGLIHLQLL